MLTDQTIHTLSQLQLNGMSDAYSRQLRDAHAAELTFEDRLGLLVDHEWTLRQNGQFARLLKKDLSTIADSRYTGISHIYNCLY